MDDLKQKFIPFTPLSFPINALEGYTFSSELCFGCSSWITLGHFVSSVNVLSFPF